MQTAGAYELYENIIFLTSFAPADAVASAPPPATAVPVSDADVSLLFQSDGCWRSITSSLKLTNLLATIGPTIRTMNRTNIEK